MKKKYAVTAIAAVLIAGAAFLPPVQAATESALSVFRVSDAKTITISVTDLQDLASAVKKLGIAKQSVSQSSKKTPASVQQTAASALKSLESTQKFTSFSASLPTAKRSETPKLYALDSQTKTVTLNTDKINAVLQKIGGGTLSSSYNGTQIQVVTPPAFVAVYSNVTLVETQGLYLKSSSGTVDALWNKFANLSVIPSDLRTQLTSIDPTEGSVYLPVIEGLGRSTDLGLSTGYLYSAKSLAQVASAVPDLANASVLAKLQSDQTTVLIWTKNGVLYALAGQQSDSALTQIARSIH